MILTPDQQQAHDALVAFAANPMTSHVTLGGYAGTGKTTVTAAMVRTLRSRGLNNLAFCCYTGKASSVLRQKLQAVGALGNSYCGTIHSLIYTPVMTKGGQVRFDRVDRIDADLIIVDEASMVNREIWDDLTSYRVPIIAVGDHGQLPPIAPPGAEPFNLMAAPLHRLEKIHRQAEGNPIIRLATLARLEGSIPHGRAGYGVGCYRLKNDAVIGRAHEFGRLRSTLFLCAINRTRVIVNKAIRSTLGYKGETPCVGEKVICLKNNRRAHIYNGVTGEVASCLPTGARVYSMCVRMDDGVTWDGQALREQFDAPSTIRVVPGIDMREVDLFDYGYCLTVHKSQGSEAENVVLFMERMEHQSDEDWRRWLYTGITRAKKFLTVVNRLYTKRTKEEDALDAGLADALAREN